MYTVRSFFSLLLLMFASVSQALDAPVSLTPPGLSPGQNFYLIFTTKKEWDATATDIATYNTNVNLSVQEHGTDDMKALTWQAVVATIDGGNQCSSWYTDVTAPVYRLGFPNPEDVTKSIPFVLLAHNKEQMFNATFESLTAINLRDDKTLVANGVQPPTGCWGDQPMIPGVPAPDFLLDNRLGGDPVAVGLVADHLNDNTRISWITFFWNDQLSTDVKPYYAVSPVLTVPDPTVTFAIGNRLNMDGNTITGLAMATGTLQDAANRDFVELGVPEPGINKHDMQYWDGTRWALIPAPEGDQSMLSMCGGVPAWTKSGCLHVGDIGPAGGRVFYVTDGGGHGLEFAPEDQSAAATWGCNGTLIIGAGGTAYGSGAQNTADILAGCTEAGIAAKLADDYTLNGYSDWFLPGKDAMARIYETRFVGHFPSDFYWTSTQRDSGAAWAVPFVTASAGKPLTLEKNSSIGVRAIRAF
jgi:hypothetical protein